MAKIIDPEDTLGRGYAEVKYSEGFATQTIIILFP